MLILVLNQVNAEDVGSSGPMGQQLINKMIDNMDKFQVSIQDVHEGISTSLIVKFESDELVLPLVV